MEGMVCKADRIRNEMEEKMDVENLGVICLPDLVCGEGRTFS